MRDTTDQKRIEERARHSREQLWALSAHLEELREQERIDVARELHDEVGQAMTALQMDLAWLRQQNPQTGAIKKRLQGMWPLPSVIDASMRVASHMHSTSVVTVAGAVLGTVSADDQVIVTKGSSHDLPRRD